MDRLVTLLSRVLDAIVPRRDRSLRTSMRTLEEVPLSPTPHELLGTRIMTLMSYREQAVQDLVQSLKYDRSRHAASLDASVLADYLREEIASQRMYSPRRVVLIPVPLHGARHRERGFNQMEMVLRALPSEFMDGSVSRIQTDAITRVRATKQQTRLHRTDRLSNVAGAFAVRSGASLHDAHVFLIDDVTTTGATLANAAQPLRRAGAHVTLLALARA